MLTYWAAGTQGHKRTGTQAERTKRTDTQVFNYAKQQHVESQTQGHSNIKSRIYPSTQECTKPFKQTHAVIGSSNIQACKHI